MGEAAAFGKIQRLLAVLEDRYSIKRMEVLRGAHKGMFAEARKELANARKLLEAACDLLAAHHPESGDEYVEDVRKLVAACRAETNNQQG